MHRSNDRCCTVKKDAWAIAIIIAIGVAVYLAFRGFIAIADWQLERACAAAVAEITEEEQERLEQAAYYKGWQDCKQYYLENFGG